MLKRYFRSVFGIPSRSSHDRYVRNTSTSLLMKSTEPPRRQGFAFAPSAQYRARPAQQMVTNRYVRSEASMGRWRMREGTTMTADLLDLYTRASEWSAEKVAGITDLDGATSCEPWRVRDLLNHMLETQRYFVGAARGEDASPPGQTPPDVLSDDPKSDFARAGAEVLATFS